MAHEMARGGLCGRPDGHKGEHRSPEGLAVHLSAQRRWEKNNPEKVRGFHRKSRSQVSVDQRLRRLTQLRERYATDPEYRKKRLASSREYRDQNREKVYATNRRYYQENRDRILERGRARDLRNRDYRLAYQREYYLKHRDRIIEATAKWRQENPEKLHEYTRSWQHLLAKMKHNTKRTLERKG